MGSLLVVQGPNQGATYSLARDRIVLGRHHSCDIVLNVPEASREHACISRVGAKYYLEDLDSRNGTRVNERAIHRRVRLGHNDQIQIGGLILAFHDVSAGPSTAEMEALAVGPERHDESDESSTVEMTVRSGVLHLERQSAEQLQTLLQVSGDLSRSLDVEELARLTAERLIELFKQADRVLVLLEDATNGNLIPRAIQIRAPQTRSDARCLRSMVLHCMDRSQAILSDNLPRDRRFGQTPLVKELNLRAVICVPLCSQDGTAFGAIELDTSDQRKRFSEADLHLLVCVAGQASLALENALLHRDQVARQRLLRDLNVAREVQRCFLPQSPPAIPGYEFFAYSEPVHEVGGDYYDFIPLGDGRLAVTLGDIAGKGVPAALLMAKLSAEARCILPTEPDLAAALGRLNQMLLEYGAPSDRFVTFGAAILDPARHTLTVGSAGQSALLLLRRESRAVVEALPRDMVGIPLGVSGDWAYRSHRLELGPGDCLIACTDSIIGAWSERGEAFGLAGMTRALTAAPSCVAELGDCLVEAVRQHLGTGGLLDDLTLLCAGRVS
jgi:serine phosphatase RsbU (regulator of sigma subunit)/pSer/pThr/pTyr-binding forkhead associated (FHA) protein